jgi:hypothetical protein
MFCHDVFFKPVVRKLLVDADLRLRFLKKLRAMNIHRASLFPGLDGFGRSLKLNGQEKDSLERPTNPQRNAQHRQGLGLTRRTKRQREKANSPVVQVVQLESPPKG